MPDGTTTGLMQLWSWVRDFAVLLFGLIFINQRKTQKDIDCIKVDYVHKTTLEKSVDRLRDDMQIMHKETRQDIKNLSDRIK